jgi:hypothetical protein
MPGVVDEGDQAAVTPSDQMVLVRDQTLRLLATQPTGANLTGL